MNVELLQKVKAKILAEPKAINMETWICESTRTPYKTVACIAGWASLLSGVKVGNDDLVRNHAAKKLKLSSPLGFRLFYPAAWPNDLHFALLDCNPGTKKYASIVAARIDRFIETDGAE